MKKYNRPEIEIENILIEDIMTTSCGIMQSSTKEKSDFAGADDYGFDLGYVTIDELY